MTTPETSTFIELTGFDHRPMMVRASIIMAVRQHPNSTRIEPISVLAVQYGHGEGDWTVRESVESVLTKISKP